MKKVLLAASAVLVLATGVSAGCTELQKAYTTCYKIGKETAKEKEGGYLDDARLVGAYRGTVGSWEDMEYVNGKYKLKNSVLEDTCDKAMSAGFAEAKPNKKLFNDSCKEFMKDGK